MHVAQADGLALVPHGFGDDRLVHDRVGVCHGKHRGEPAFRGGRGPRGDGFGVFPAGFLQVHVDVHQAGQEHIETTFACVLAVEPGDEQLWRMRILAAYARHNPAAVDEAINRLYAQLEALDTTPEDRTEEFLTELRKGTALTTLMEMI